MFSLAAVIWALGHPWILIMALVLKWWAIWFTLGHFFLRTTLLLLATVSCSWASSQILLISGALGPSGFYVDLPDSTPLEEPDLIAWLAALFFTWVALGALETFVLRWGMRKWSRSAWSWRLSDLSVYLSWHGVVVLLAGWVGYRELVQV
jgi:hypothetical protein